MNNHIIDRYLIKIMHLQNIEYLKNLNTKNIYNISNTIYNKIYDIIDSPISLSYIILRLEILAKYQSILTSLNNIPILTQKSDKWYNMRNTMITASDFAQCLGKGKFNSQQEFLIRKINVAHNINIDNNNSNYNIPLIWGNKFEKCAIDIYKLRNNNIKVYEFGLLKHHNQIDNYFFGASPDGITELGIMLEIKCPFKRKITGEIPEQYYMQIQGQLEVCNLNECDYLECKFSLYNDEADFINDTYISMSNKTNNLTEKGIIIIYNNQYYYSDPNFNTIDMIKWKNELIKTFDFTSFYQIEYWKLDEYMCKRIYKDNTYKNNYHNLKFIWEKIQFYKKPENKDLFIKDILKNKKKLIYNTNEESDNTKKKTKCLINLD